MNRTPTPSEVFFNPLVFAETFLKILDRHKNLIPLRYNAAQRYFLEHRTGRDILIKSRQLGFTTLSQAEMFRYATTGTCTTLTLTHLDDTTAALRRMSDRFLDNLPIGFRPNRKYANASVTTYSDFGSEAVIATAGSKHSTRGLTVTHAHLSECAFYKDAGEIVGSILQTIPPEGTLTIETTCNGASGWLFDEVNRALRGDSIFKVWFFGWWWEPTNSIPLLFDNEIVFTDDEFKIASQHDLIPEQIKWRRLKQRELGRLFPQEQAEDINTAFLSSGAQVFGDFTVYTPESDAKPIAGHECVAGLDTGQDNDYSALSIIDPETNKEVFIDHWRHMPWSEIRTNVLDACAYWNVGKLYVERNAASATIEALHSDAYVRKIPISISGITTTLKRKGEMVIHLRTAIQEDGLELLDVAWASAEMRAVQTKQTEQGVWTYTSPRDENGHGDGVIARMLAVRASLNRIAEFT